MPTLKTDDLEAAVDAILAATGGAVACGTPLGLGKPVPLLNALYGRVKANPVMRLDILTALSLDVPRAKGGLERRFLDPFARRVFEGVPRLDYLRDLASGAMPPHIRLYEFYFRPGSMLGFPGAQQNYLSSNYTHAGRDMVARGANAIAVMVAERDGRYSLGSNPDLTLDVARGMRASGRPCIVAGLVNRNLPFMLADAEVPESFFDVLVDSPRHEHPLFGVPNPSLDAADHAIGFYASSLVKDGGTLQLGIGSIGDGVAHWLRERHVSPDTYREMARALDIDRYEALVAAEGGFGPFAEGLFASSEMFTWGMMCLMQAGVIRRHAEGDGGPVLQAGFFLGPREFYRVLRELPEAEREKIRMTSVTRVNDLFGEEEMARRQRHDARFINVCMMMTLFGAAVSDALADGRIVSGVGGQYNFVAMAHELERARSVLLLRSTREAAGCVESNVVFNYGHTTIPRHLRDIVVSEYGIADLRGRTDGEVAAALIGIADARFQERLAREARRAGKLPKDWQVPEAAKGNTPERLARDLAAIAERGALPAFPLGTDFDEVEQRLVPALQWLKANAHRKIGLPVEALMASPRPSDAAALARMGLSAPLGLGETLLRKLLVLALRKTEPAAP